MKKNVFLTGMLALVLVFGLAVIGCDNSGDDDDYGTPTTIEDVQLLIESSDKGNTPDDPIPITIIGSAICWAGGNSNQGRLGDLLGETKKYVALDLSKCTKIGLFSLSSNKTSGFGGKWVVSIVLPKNMKSIEIMFATNNTSLESVTISNSVTQIEQDAFYGCTSLASITIPDGVWIGRDAFRGCTSLTSVTFEGTIASFYSAFEGDLRTKFYATDSDNGTPGRYTTTAPVTSESVWTKQE